MSENKKNGRPVPPTVVVSTGNANLDFESGTDYPLAYCVASDRRVCVLTLKSLGIVRVGGPDLGFEFINADSLREWLTRHNYGWVTFCRDQKTMLDSLFGI